MLLPLCLSVIVFASGAAAQTASVQVGPQIDSLNAAARAGDFARALRHVHTALELEPANIPLLDQLVRTRGRLRDSLGVIAALERTLPLGGARPVLTDPIFAFMSSNRRFQQLGARLERTLASLHRSETVRVLEPGVDLGEGISASTSAARESGAVTLFGGGLPRGGVTRLRLTQDSATASTVLETGGSPLGMKVDARGDLWANLSFPAPDGPTRSEVVVIDVGRGAITRRIRSPADGQSHLFNDLSLASDGTVYLTDSDASKVYMLPNGTRDSTGMVRAFFEGAGDVRGTNGIAVTSDGRRLYVAHLFGIDVWQLRSGVRSRVRTRSSWPIGSADGLYTCGGALVAVQTLPGADRVLWIDVDPARARVRRWRVLEQTSRAEGTLSTGTVVGRHFYFHVSRRGAPAAGSETPGPVHTVVKRVRLPRAC
jgi:hypothetical protein